MTEKINSDLEVGAYFMQEVPQLLSMTDIFGEKPKIIQVKSRQLSITTVDPDSQTVRSAFFVKEGAGFDLIDVEHLYNSFEGSVLKSGVLCRINTKK